MLKSNGVRALDRADYGLDAPAVVRNLFVAGGAGLLLALAILSGIAPDAIRWTTTAGQHVNIGLLGLGLGPGIACTATGLAMVWSSRIGKVRHRDRLLQLLPWRGDEQVLDVGCGRGLMLIGAAKRLTSGRAIGVDVWRSEDLSGNNADATLTNARLEGVEDRVRIETSDMRALPFPSGSIDLVLSCAAIHNLDRAADRAKTITEIARVLKPGGFALVDDIRHFAEYQETFAKHDCPLHARLDNRIVSAVWSVISFGSLRPGTLLVRKAA